MADDEGTAAVRERLKDRSEGGTEYGGFLLDQIRIDSSKRFQVLAIRPPSRLEPALLDRGPEPGVHRHSAGDRSAHSREQASEGLGRSLGSGRDQQVEVTLDAPTDFDRHADARGGEYVALRVGVPPKLDDLRHNPHHPPRSRQVRSEGGQSALDPSCAGGRTRVDLPCRASFLRSSRQGAVRVRPHPTVAGRGRQKILRTSTHLVRSRFQSLSVVRCRSVFRIAGAISPIQNPAYSPPSAHKSKNSVN